MSEHPEHSCVSSNFCLVAEVLPEILEYLCPSDLKRLRFVNQKLYALVEAYQAQFDRGLIALPNEIVLEIIQYLHARDKSRLARVSHRFYPLVMDSILRDNIRYQRSSLLHFSVKQDLKSLTRKIVCRGGDLNPTAIHLSKVAMLPRPLSIAAYYGFEEMVKLLIELGANPSGQGTDIPLRFAISKRHERVALILLHSSDSINGKACIASGKLLQMAAAAKMVTLVSHLLQRRSELHTRDLDTALYHVLLGDVCKQEVLERALHQEVYQIVLMLLENGANPGVRPAGKVVPTLVTARRLSSRHPDPRVRALLLDTTSMSCLRESIKSDSLVGRSWGVSSEIEAAPNSEPPDWYANRLLFARLSDFLEKPYDGELSVFEDHHVTNDVITHDEAMHGTQHVYTTFDLAASLGNARQSEVSERSLRAEILSSDAFPQLGAPIGAAQQVDRGIWANPNPSVHSSYPTTVCAPSAKSRVSASRKSLSLTEEFPQLAIPSSKPIYTEKGMWANILKAQPTRNMEAVGCTGADTDRLGTNETSINSRMLTKKKAKWVPLSI